MTDPTRYGGSEPCPFCGKHFQGVHVLHVIQTCRGDALSEVEARRQLREAETPAPALMATRRLADLGSEHPMSDDPFKDAIARLFPGGARVQGSTSNRLNPIVASGYESFTSAQLDHEFRKHHYEMMLIAEELKRREEKKT